jgi:PPK2 family polyphosphate:nucleotide phosphotransferase
MGLNEMADERRQRLEELVAPFRVTPGSTVTLGEDFDPSFKAGMKKQAGVAMLADNTRLLSEYQTRLAAQGTWGLLMICSKVPSAEELSHDYLWRYSGRLPARGEIGIFNRSQYEEVLVVRVHPEHLDRQRLPHGATRGDVWHRRYREINDWERYLSDNGFRIVKLFLNLSREEQRLRLLRRLDRPDRNWKFSSADIAERARWDDYQKAFSEMLSHTSTEWAPWYVIPADRKWFARLGAGTVLLRALMKIDPHFRVLGVREREELRTSRAALEAQAPTGAAPDPSAPERD